jgi:acyl-CoA synthetase (AMP-forming)/AMP-acid ligase II
MLGDLLRRKPYNAVTDFVDAPVARGLAEKIAFIDAKRSLSYGDLQKRTCCFAAALIDLGLKPEERLALLLYDTVDFPVAFWGALRAGIVALPLNTLLTAEQYAYILADSRVRDRHRRAASQDPHSCSRSPAAAAHNHSRRRRRERARCAGAA